MAEKWKHNAARAIERLAYAVEKLANQLERYNDKNDTNQKRIFTCPVCDRRATLRATTDIQVTLDCQNNHPVQEMEEENEVA